jgi:hypothetical protein
MAKPCKGIAQLSNAVDILVSTFIRPNAQQALANYERIERIEGVAERNVEAISITCLVIRSKSAGDRDTHRIIGSKSAADCGQC